MRRVHTMIYFADGTSRKLNKQKHPCVDRAGIAPGALVQSDVTPIAWPRARGRSAEDAAAARSSDPRLARLDAAGVRMKPTPHPWSRDFAWQPPRGAFRRIDAAQARELGRARLLRARGRLRAADDRARDRGDRPVREEVRGVPAQAARRQAAIIARADEITFTTHLVARSPYLREFASPPGVLRSGARPDRAGRAALLGPGGVQEAGEAAAVPVAPGQRLHVRRAAGVPDVLGARSPMRPRTNGCPRVVPGLHRGGTLAHRPTDLGFVCFDEPPRAPRRRARARGRHRGVLVAHAARDRTEPDRARRGARTSCSTRRTARSRCGRARTARSRASPALRPSGSTRSCRTERPSTSADVEVDAELRRAELRRDALRRGVVERRCCRGAGRPSRRTASAQAATARAHVRAGGTRAASRRRPRARRR